MVFVPVSIVLVKRPIKSPVGVTFPIASTLSVVVRPTVPPLTLDALNVESAK